MLLTRERSPLTVIAKPNSSWALDFMHDSLYWGKRFRCLNILDEGVRECLGVEVDTSIPAERVVRALDNIAQYRGYPEQIRMDNGPELVSRIFVEWCTKHDINMAYIQPGKPNQNAYIERFNRTMRHEVLDAYLFESLDQVREITSNWRVDYNESRPHDALGGMTPADFRMKVSSRNSILELCP